MRYCSPVEAARRAEAAGRAGNAAPFQESQYAICDSIVDIRSAYKKGYHAGLTHFCSDEGAQNSGLIQGRAGGPNQFPREKYQICGGGNLSRLRSQFAKGYGKGLVQFCGSIESDASEVAHRATTFVFPPKFQVCQTSVPDLVTRYRSAFDAERVRFVQAQCTFQNGMGHGSSEAQTGRETRDTVMPVFCDDGHFAIYLQGYLEGWRTGKERFCNVDKAYQKGMDDGIRGWMMSYQPTPGCSAEFGDRMQSRYREGYLYAQSVQQPYHSVAQNTLGGSMVCSREVTSRSGTVDSERCGMGAGSIACYWDVTETCRNRNNGQVEKKSFRQYNGRCVSGFSECW